MSGARGGHLPPSSTDPARYDAGYVGGEYEIAGYRAADQGEATLEGVYADASIAVDAELVNPSPISTSSWPAARGTAVSQYRFSFRPATGAFRIDRWHPIPGLGPQSRALLPDDPISPAIRRGSATNRAELSCHGTTITARINGVTVASAADNTFRAGRMWIAVSVSRAGPDPDAKPVARFSNLVLTEE